MDFFIYVLPSTNGFSHRLNESSKSMIDWKHLFFSFEQRVDSLNENLVVKSNTNGSCDRSRDQLVNLPLKFLCIYWRF